MEDQKKEKTLYQKIRDGEVEPEGAQKGWANLEAGRRSFNQLPKEELAEISRKGAEAVNKLHGEKKSARESLEKILTLKATPEIIGAADLPDELAERLRRDNPNATLYDLIQIVAVGRAVGGNMKAYELIRDTHGDKPQDKLQIEANNIMTEADRAMIEKISARLDDPSVHIEIVQDDKETKTWMIAFNKKKQDQNGASVRESLVSRIVEREDQEPGKPRAKRKTGEII